MTELEHSLEETPDEDDEAPSTELPSQIADRYRVVRLLGQGGMGRVLLAEDAKGNAVAIKLVTRADARGRERLLREAEAIARLDSPGIVKLHEVVQGDDALAIVMEHVDGPDLEAHLKDSGPLPWEAAVALLLGVVEALAHAHERGVVHRDVKPANVLIGPDGAARLCDFGLARAEQIGSLADSLTQPGAVLGTLDYMAPEQRDDPRRVEPAADVFSVGATLYRAVTGEPPRVIRERRIPERVRGVVLRCMEHSPDQRYPNCQALARALRSLLPREVPAKAPVPIELPPAEVSELVSSALAYQAEQGGPIEEALGLVGLQPDAPTYAAMAQVLDVAYVDAPPAEAVADPGIPRAVAEAYRLAPIGRDGDVLLVAAADPGDMGAAVQAVQGLTGASLQTCLAPPPVVARGIEQAYGTLPPEPVVVFEPLEVEEQRASSKKASKPKRRRWEGSRYREDVRERALDDFDDSDAFDDSDDAQDYHRGSGSEEPPALVGMVVFLILGFGFVLLLMWLAAP